MAVKLRLTRRGKKKQPFYRIVAIDSRAKRDGKYIDKLGHYNPLTNPADVLIDEEKVLYWLKNGAIPTDTVKNLLSKNGLWMKWSLMKQGADEKKIEEEMKKWEVLQLERQKRQEALEAQKK
ncbi:30S ribosomal protein S16, partial [candidate division KSB1 bacterium 4484_87]